jgi:hypothetical protein
MSLCSLTERNCRGKDSSLSLGTTIPLISNPFDQFRTNSVEIFLHPIIFKEISDENSSRHP